jgi:hypothetical protein
MAKGPETLAGTPNVYCIRLLTKLFEEKNGVGERRHQDL